MRRLPSRSTESASVRFARIYGEFASRCIFTTASRIEDEDGGLPPLAVKAPIAIGIIASLRRLDGSKDLDCSGALRKRLDRACFAKRDFHNTLSKEINDTSV